MNSNTNFLSPSSTEIGPSKKQKVSTDRSFKNTNLNSSSSMVSPINSKSNNQLNNNSKSFNRSSLSIERESISNSNLKNFNNDNSIEDSIKLELKNRMLISGEWLKLSKLLRDRLKGSKWEEDLRCQAENRALEADHPSLHTLMDYLRPIAQETIPTELKDEVFSCIKSFVESNIELNQSD